MLVAAEITADQLNAKGGITLGGKKYKLVVHSCDSQYAVGPGVACFNKLITQDHIKVLIGPVSSAVVLALRAKIDSDKLISMADSYGFVLNKHTPYLVRIGSTTTEIDPAFWHYVAEKYPNKKALGVIGPDNATGTSAATGTSQAAAKYGVTTVANVLYPLSTTNFTSYVTALLSKKPDVIDTQDSPDSASGAIMKILRQDGYTGMIVKTGGIAPSAEYSVAGSASNGLVYSEPCDLTNPKVISYEKLYAQKTSIPFDALSCEWHDGMVYGFAALQKAGSLNAAKYVAALQSMSPFQGPLMGTIKMGGLKTYGINNQMYGHLYFYKLENGKSRLLGSVMEKSP